MYKVNYNPGLLDILKDLSRIDMSVIFEKDEKNNVVVKRADTEQTIAYQLKAPSEYFSVQDDKIAFYMYNEFYQYYKAFSDGDPEISIDNNKIFLSLNESKSDYKLSSPESIKDGPKSINFTNPDIKFNLTSKDLDEFSRMIALIKPKKIQIFGTGDKITLKIFNNIHENTFEKTFHVENFGEIDDEIDFVIFSETLDCLPIKRDYTIEIKKQGFVKISLIDENISLDIFTGKVKV
jgi:hypothetical protein